MSSRKFSHTNTYIFAMASFTQDDHPTTGTWATCGFTGKILMPSKLARMLHEHLFDLPGGPWSSAGSFFVKK